MSIERQMQDAHLPNSEGSKVHPTDRVAIHVEHVSKSYLIYDSPQDRLKQSLWRGRRNYYHEFKALQDISFTIGKGETVGIVGRNGSGKSTLLQIICGTVTPSSGNCEVQGRISALLELGAGFNPEFTGRENIFLNGAILGLSQEEIREKYNAIVEFSGIGDKVNQAVRTYSSGMYIRLAFAVAVASDPDILIVDEALAVGDEIFQRKCFAHIRSIQERGGTVLFVSHAAATIIEICDRAVLLDSGELLMIGTPKNVISQYHKLIYAPDEKTAELRKEIQLLGNRHNDEVLSQEEQLPTVCDPAMIPESTVSYESRGATISCPRLETLQGQPINLLQRGSRYRFCYRVTFSEDAYSVHFGMLIRTKSGLELGGCASADEDTLIETITAGTIYDVSFDFDCLLLPGTYFLNCGCIAKINNVPMFLHRILDATMFKVLPEQQLVQRGIVDFLITSEVKKIT